MKNTQTIFTRTLLCFVLFLNTACVNASQTTETLDVTEKEETTQIVDITTFTDVDDSTAYHEAIEYLQTNGIVEGYADGTFKPDQTLNRAELLKILVEGTTSNVIPDLIENPDYQNCFPDVKDEWFAPYVCYAKEKEIVGGYPDGSFQPSNTIAFVEMAKIIVNTMELEISEVEEDAPWYKQYVLLLSENKRVPRTITTFDQEITRGEMAEMVWRVREEVVIDYYDWVKFGELELNRRQLKKQKINSNLSKLFFGVIADQGENGKIVDCGNSIVGVLSETNSNSSSNEEKIKNTLEKLFSIKSEKPIYEDFKNLYDEISGNNLIMGKSLFGIEDPRGLYNALSLSDLIVDGITINNNVVKINISGSYAMGGNCDGPSFVEQIKQTVMQFDFIKKAEICVSNRPIEEFGNLSGKPVIENYCQ